MVILECERSSDGYVIVEAGAGFRDIIFDGVVLAVGSFDGLHVAHKLIINELVRVAKELKKPSVLVTFNQHPKEIVEGYKSVKLLCTKREKIERLRKLGIDCSVFIKFSKQFSEDSADFFLREFLLRKMKMVHLVSGFDHGFGNKREGNVEFCRSKSLEYGFNFSVISQHSFFGVEVSSSNVKALIASGEFDMVKNLLGEPYYLTGVVVRGDGKGKSLGYPTANLKVDEAKFIPSDGVYLVSVQVGENDYLGLMNIGRKPTVSLSNQLHLEVHILKYSGELYGQNITVLFVKKIREERRFNNVSELKLQIARDVAEVEHELFLVNK